MELISPSTAAVWEQPAITVELVWETGRDATAIAGGSPCCSGVPVRVGPAAGWLPAHHLTLAAASSFMSVLMQLAESAGVPILGFVSTAKLCVPPDARSLPHVMLNPSIVVGSPDDAAMASVLAAEAAESSDVCRIFRGRLLVNPDIQVAVEEVGAHPSR